MNKDSKTRVLLLMAATIEICGGNNISDEAAEIMLSELYAYTEQQITSALKKCRTEITGRLSLAAIISRIDDGRLGAEEAWAMMPKYDSESAVISDEMIQAWGTVSTLYNDDPVAARMAFRETYSRIVSKNRAAGIPVKWFPSLGYSESGREAPLLEAAKLGRLEYGHAIALLPMDAKLKIEQKDQKQIESSSKALHGPSKLEAKEIMKAIFAETK